MKAFARFIIQQLGVHTMDNEAIAIAWCDLIDRKDTKLRLPSHIRTHLADWE
jgi:hypothetical protein